MELIQPFQADCMAFTGLAAMGNVSFCHIRFRLGDLGFRTGGGLDLFYFDLGHAFVQEGEVAFHGDLDGSLAIQAQHYNHSAPGAFLVASSS